MLKHINKPIFPQLGIQIIIIIIIIIERIEGPTPGAILISFGGNDLATKIVPDRFLIGSLFWQLNFNQKFGFVENKVPYTKICLPSICIIIEAFSVMCVHISVCHTPYLFLTSNIYRCFSGTLCFQYSCAFRYSCDFR